MATNRNTLKSWFTRGKKPLASQFAEWLDSYFHKDDTIPVTSIEGLDVILGSKANQSENDQKYDKAGGEISGRVTIRPSDWAYSGYIFEIVDPATDTVIAGMTKNGQWEFRGNALANPAMKFFNKDGNVFINFNSLLQNGFFDVCDADGNIVCHIDSAGVSKFYGVDVQLQKIINVADAVFSNDAVNKGQLDSEVDLLTEAMTELSTNKEDAGVAAGLITNLKDGVSASGDTMLKLYNLIVASFSEVTVANITARNAYNVTNLPTNVFVTDDGDGRWALYKAITTGTGATFVKLSDPDLLNALMSASQIKSSYESNSNTNAFTDALKNKLDSLYALVSGTNIKTVNGTSLLGSGDILVSGEDIRTVPLGSVSGTVNVDMSAGVQFTATMGNSTTFNFTNIVVNKPIFIKVNGAFTITLVTTGVTFHYITVDTYDPTKSMLWVMFTDSTNANYNFKNID